MCLYPTIIRNKKYTANIKNGGVIPPLNDRRTLAIPVGCGKCIECRKQKKREWQVRLHEEIRSTKLKKHFVTMTYDNDKYKKYYDEVTIENKLAVIEQNEDGKIKLLTAYEIENEIATRSIRHFLERWRKKYGKSVRHWCVTELGGGRYEHMHIHGIIFTDVDVKAIEERWQNGFVYLGEYVNEKTVNYIVKYINKPDIIHKSYQAKILTSSGIGRSYLEREDSKGNKYKPTGTRETYKTRQGMELPLPIYYKNHIYTDEQKEKLWIEKLDKNERFVMGEKIDMNKEKSEEEYIKAREEARIISKKLGYDKKDNWKDKEYQNARRELIQKRRILDTINTEMKLKDATPNEAFG